MKVYISGAISNVKNYMEDFERAEKYLKSEGFIPVNPAKVNGCLPPETSYEEYMKMSICMLEMCDAIYMIDGWQKSLGANREYGFAMAKDKVIMMEGKR